MKSLVEEASSVVKAIEKAWNRAGNPQTFSVKVYETPETNFFGFTKKSAKVGIFFEEETPNPVKKYTNNRDQRSHSNNRTPQRGRQNSSTQTHGTEVDQAPASSSSNRPARAPYGPRTPGQQSAPVRQEHSGERREHRVNNEQQSAGRSEEKQRPRRTNERPDRASSYDQDRPVRQERERSDRPSFEDKRVNHANPADYNEPTPTAVYREEKVTGSHYNNENRRDNDHREPEYKQESRDGGEGRERRNNSRDRDRGGDRQGNRNNARPQRAQRHEFNEERDMVYVPQESHQDPYVEKTPHVASEDFSTPTTPVIAPQKKVLKVSGRRYSAPVKKDDE